MKNANVRTGGHLSMLAEDEEEMSFLRSFPWIIDADLHQPDVLIKTLRHETSRFTELLHQPIFSLLTVLRDTPPRHLREFIWSCRCQSYRNWQLYLVDDGSTSREHMDIARRWVTRDERIHLRSLEAPLGLSRARNIAVDEATGDYLIVAEGDGVLHPMALGVLARHINDGPNVDFVFSNEAEIDSRSTDLTNFLVKPPLDLFTLLRIHYVGRLYAVRRTLLETATQGGVVFRHEYDGIEEHDLLLRLALSGAVESRHVPLFLYYRRAESVRLTCLTARELAEKRRSLLEEHVPRAYPGMTWQAKVSKDRDPLAPSSIWITDVPGRQAPRLLIIIPFKDQVETTIQCLESMEKQEHRLDVVVALVNNRSIEPRTLPRLRSWIEGPRTSKYEILDHDGAFNFARLNNAAVGRLGEGQDLVLLLNNDVELTTPQCLQSMAMQLLADPSIGFVGIRLYYPDGKEIQHGGIRMGAYIRGSGFYEILHARSAAEFVDADHISLGVTFACAMTRRETFERLGGLEEIFFPNGYSDVNACLRALEAGLRNYYLGSLTGIHHESKSRGVANEDLEFSTLYERHGRTIASWRLRHLHRSHRYAWPLIVLPWNYSPSAPDQSAEDPAPETQPAPLSYLLHPSFPLPLRHRIADKIVQMLKMGLGPAYRIMRAGVSKAGVTYRLLRTPGAMYSLIKEIIEPIPLMGPACASVIRAIRKLKARSISLGTLIHHLLLHPAAARGLTIAWLLEGYQGFREELALQVPALRPRGLSMQEWFEQTCRSPRQLAGLRAQQWTKEAPKITVIMPVYNVREDWLSQAIESVIAQTYPHWELICVNDGSPAEHIRPVLDKFAGRDSRVIVIHCPRNRGVSAATNLALEASNGDYVSFMDHDDFLEPHALHRFAEAILNDRPDLIYSDEVVTSEDLDEILLVSARSAFSYDHYLGHPYFVHLIAARSDLVRQVGGLDEAMSISQDVDLNLRLIEVCQTICHISEVLYRWRTHATSLGHQKKDQCRAMTRGALERHFARTGQVVQFEDRTHFNFRDLRFQHETRARVAILIPARNRPDFLRTCVASLEQTVDLSLVDIIVIDHQPENANSLGELAEVRKRHRVVTHHGSFNFSAIINAGVASVRGPYTHYLLLSHEIEAVDSGWLEHMLGYGERADVGVVGAMLLDGSERVRHAGLVIGLNGLADTAYKDAPYRGWLSGCYSGQDCSLLASRDVSAVSAACMLTRSDVFHRLSGFDERLGVLNDVDYCLRASSLGYKIIQDAYAILLHSGAEARKADVDERHSEEARLFLDRYGELIRKGDSFYSPLLSRFTTSFPFNHLATRDRVHAPRTTRVVLPAPTTTGRSTRFDAQRLDLPGRRPHHIGLSDASRRKTRP